MDKSQPLLMQMLGTQMSYMTDRQTVLAQNISNIDTPNYKSYDLKKLDFNRLAEAESARLEMRATSAKHLSGTLGNASDFRNEKVRKPFEITPVGNNVVLEEQMAKINDTGAKFQYSSTLYNKYNQLHRIAVKGSPS